MPRLLVLALIVASACGSDGRPAAPRAGEGAPVYVGQVPHEEGCARTRAACDVAKERCERGNRSKSPTDEDPLLVPCDLEYGVCLGRCRAGQAPP